MNEGYGVQGVINFCVPEELLLFFCSSCSLSLSGVSEVLLYVVVRSKLILSCAVMDSTHSI